MIPLRKIADSDGLYAVMSDAGTVTFRYDYRLDGKRETLTIERYAPGTANRNDDALKALDYEAVISLKDARVLRDRASHQVGAGVSPSRAKVEKRTQDADRATLTNAADDARPGSESGTNTPLQCRFRASKPPHSPTVPRRNPPALLIRRVFHSGLWSRGTQAQPERIGCDI